MTTVKVSKHSRGTYGVGVGSKQEWFTNKTKAWDRAFALLKKHGGRIVYVDLSEAA